MNGLTRLAGIWSRDPDFLAWLGEHAGESMHSASAASWIRKVCGVASRKELDVDPAAAKRFLEYVRAPFMASMHSQTNKVI